MCLNELETMASVTPNGDGFRGGSRTILGRPDLISGTLAPANVAASVIGGVNPGEQRSARGDRGTNVTIPYARVVFHPGATTALPRVGKLMSNPLVGLNGVMPNTESISETDYLGAGTVGFVLGRRGNGYDPGVSAVMDVQNGATTLFSRQQDKLAQFALIGAGVDTNTAQRMCSIEYLESYFHFVLRKKVVSISNAILADEMKNVARRWPKTKLEIAGVKPSGFDTTDWVKAIVKPPADPPPGKLPASWPEKANKQGVFACDRGPFLRGYTINRRFVKDTHLSIGFGDQIGFDILQQRLMQKGLCDWTPDGIVHSKLSSGDASTDYDMDARDGQLFNVVVKGSAIAVSWTYDKYRDIMPGDQLFLVIVGDVWERADDWTENKIEADDAKGYEEKQVSLTFKIDADLVNAVASFQKYAADLTKILNADESARDAVVSKIVERLKKVADDADEANTAADDNLADARRLPTGTPEQQAKSTAVIAAAMAEKEAATAALNVANEDLRKFADMDATKNTAIAWLTAGENDTSNYHASAAATRYARSAADDAPVNITNFRPRLMTSTEMMQYSAVTKPTGIADRTSRLGLRANAVCREYIVGGWSIGHVIDNSASRPIENRSALGVAKRNKTSHACNVLVNVRWWSADRMFRNFMNKEGALRSRFDAFKKIPMCAENRPAYEKTAAVVADEAAAAAAALAGP